MMFKVIIVVCLWSVSIASFSQEPVLFNYAVDNIAADLKKDATVVYRLDEAILEIASPAKYTLQVHQVTTILNAEGTAYLQQTLAVNKFNSIDAIEITVYNGVGLPVRKYKKKDFSVQGYNDGISLATDDKIMQLPLAAPGYPCTIEVKYTRSATSYVDLPNWIINNNRSSIEQFRYMVKVPPALDIRYRTTNMVLAPRQESDGKRKVYTWETKNIPAQKIAAGGYELRKYLPQIEIAPNAFEYDGYKGEFATWSDFGKWNYALYEEKNPFPEQRTAEIKKLMNGVTDVQEKVTVLYDYLKSNMRYVSIQFGIGGFKPFPARFVDEKKYGDCKALTNYMRCLLAVAGIKSYPALINAGYNKLPADPAFPKDVFNHVILCVPNGRDSIWLECTSNNSDVGYLGSFTENKNALLLTEKGGVLVATPKSDYNHNTLSTIHTINVNENGGAVVEGRLSCSGSFYQLLDDISSIEDDRQISLLVQYLRLRQPDKWELTKDNDFREEHRLQLKLEYDNLVDFKAGNKLFFPASIHSLCDEQPGTDTTNKTEYIFRFPYKKADTTYFHLPSSMEVDNVPKTVTLTNNWVDYQREVRYDRASHTITIVSRLLLKSPIVPAADRKGVADILSTIEKEENDKIILKRKDS